jgi:hypothetical protein
MSNKAAKDDANFRAPLFLTNNTLVRHRLKVQHRGLHITFKMRKKACALLSLDVTCTSCPKSNWNSTLCSTCRSDLLSHAEPANRTHCLPQLLHQVPFIDNLHIKTKVLLRATHTLLPYHTIHVQLPLLYTKSHDSITKSDPKIRGFATLANLAVWSIAIRSEFIGKRTSMCVKVSLRVLSLRYTACALN